MEEFVGNLKGFHESLDQAGQAMLGTILEGAKDGDTDGYAYRAGRYEGAEHQEGSEEQPASSGWKDLIGWIEEQGEEDTQGFGRRL